MKTFVLLVYLYSVVINPQVPVHFDNINTVEQALTELNIFFPDWGTSYSAGEFDCSEQSALVCQYLKCCGIDAEIKMGCDWENKRGHSWVEAQGKIIEATSLEIAIDDTFYKQFTTYHYKFADESEYDWWNSAYIRERCSEIEKLEQN